MLIKEKFMTRKAWIPGISDGLTLRCHYCHEVPQFDYTVDDPFWRKIVPERYRLGVVCLPCLDKLAKEKGELISGHLLEVQFTGRGETIILKPTEVYFYASKRA